MGIIYRHLLIEMTRRCNLRCRHCCKGDAENVDISPDVIKSLFSGVKHIDTLELTGGEPTLNVEGMRLILNALKANNTSLDGLFIITNGTVRDDALIDCLHDYYDYIENFNSAEKHISFQISENLYNDVDVAAAKEYWQEKIGDIAFIGTNQISILHRAGRAVDLPESENVQLLLPKYGYITPNNNHVCSIRDAFKLDADDILMACLLFVSVYGQGFDVQYAMLPFSELTPANAVIKDLNADFKPQILEYNKNKPYCTLSMIGKAYGGYLEKKDNDDIETDLRELRKLIMVLGRDDVAKKAMEEMNVTPNKDTFGAVELFRDQYAAETPENIYRTIVYASKDIKDLQNPDAQKKIQDRFKKLRGYYLLSKFYRGKNRTI